MTRCWHPERRAWPRDPVLPRLARFHKAVPYPSVYNAIVIRVRSAAFVRPTHVGVRRWTALRTAEAVAAVGSTEDRVASSVAVNALYDIRLGAGLRPGAGGLALARRVGRSRYTWTSPWDLPGRGRAARGCRIFTVVVAITFRPRVAQDRLLRGAEHRATVANTTIISVLNHVTQMAVMTLPVVGHVTRPM